MTVLSLNITEYGIKPGPDSHNTARDDGSSKPGLLAVPNKKKTFEDLSSFFKSCFPIFVFFKKKVFKPAKGNFPKFNSSHPSGCHGGQGDGEVGKPESENSHTACMIESST